MHLSFEPAIVNYTSISSCLRRGIGVLRFLPKRILYNFSSSYRNFCVVSPSATRDITNNFILDFVAFEIETLHEIIWQASRNAYDSSRINRWFTRLEFIVDCHMGELT